MENEKMIEEYLQLWAKIYHLTQGGDVSRAIQTRCVVEEIRHDQRMAQIRKEPAESASPQQKDYLQILLTKEHGVAVPDGLSKREAHIIIDLLVALKRKKGGG